MKKEEYEDHNICHVFELPKKFSGEFCFGGGIPTIFIMVDWFNPICNEDKDKSWAEIEETLKEFLKEKMYVRPNRKYLVLTGFNKSFIFEKENT